MKLPYTGAYASMPEMVWNHVDWLVSLRCASMPKSSVCSVAPACTLPSICVSASSRRLELICQEASRSKVRLSALNTGRAGRPVARLALKLV